MPLSIILLADYSPQFCSQLLNGIMTCTLQQFRAHTALDILCFAEFFLSKVSKYKWELSYHFIHKWICVFCLRHKIYLKKWKKSKSHHRKKQQQHLSSSKLRKLKLFKVNLSKFWEKIFQILNTNFWSICGLMWLFYASK